MQAQSIKAFDATGKFQGFVTSHGEVAVFGTKASALTVVDNIKQSARVGWTYKVVPAATH